MADLIRVRSIWTGSAVVGGGVSTFYLDSPAAGYVADVAAFWEGVKYNLPNTVTIQTPANGEVIDSETGDVVSGWSDGTTQTTTGAAISNVYAAGVGARVVWETNGRTNNRRVRGSTFVVPMSVDTYANDGTIAATSYAVLNDNAQSLVTNLGPSFVIWTRPNTEHGGAFSSVTARLVPDKVSWLRTRRT